MISGESLPRGTMRVALFLTLLLGVTFWVTGCGFGPGHCAPDSSAGCQPPTPTPPAPPQSLVFQTAFLPQGTVLSPYGLTLSSTGGTSPYTYSVTAGSLPVGLTMSSDGVISGSPAGAGTTSLTIQVADTAGQTASKAFTLVVTSILPQVTTRSLASGVVALGYSAVVNATGGIAPLSFTVSAGSLPPGVSLSAAGVLSGVPTTAGTYAFTVTVTDSVGGTGSQPLTIIILPPSLKITSLVVANGQVGVPYSFTLTAAGGTPGYTWSLTAGALPPPLSLSTAGVISGTPTTAGTYTFTVAVTDSLAQQTTTNLVMVVSPAALVITTASLPNGAANTAYSFTLTASGGTLPYTWTLQAGALPAGMTFSSGGLLSGTPTASGTFGLTFAVADAGGQVSTWSTSLVITPGVVVVTTTAIPDATAGVLYNTSLSASGGTPPYTWTLAAGALPAGITLSGAGVISGTTAAVGTFNFTVQATDSALQSATQPLSLTVNATNLAIATLTIPNGTVGTPYSVTLAETGGTGPYTWAVTAGALPAGITMSTGGVISGTPTASGSFTFTAQVTDSAAHTATRQYTFSIAVPPISITTITVPADVVNASYSTSLAATGGIPPYTWTVTGGALPAGITLSGGGTLSGTPTVAGTFNFTVQAADTSGLTSSKAFSLVINPAPLAISTQSLPSGSVGTAYSTSLTAGGGTPPYTWSLVSGSLPAGITLSGGGVLSGTPSAAGTFTFSVTVVDTGGQSATRSLVLTISAPAISITTSSLPVGTLNVAYSVLLAFSGGTPPVTWTVSSGSLPTGITLSTGGSLSGTPTASGTFNFTATVTDSQSEIATQAYVLQVSPPPLSVNATALGNGTVNQPYSSTLGATGGVQPYTWAVTSGTLPAGITLDPSTGILSGTPTATGSSSFTVQVTDSSSQTATRNFTLLIQTAGLQITTNPLLPNAIAGVNYFTQLTATGGTPPYFWNLSQGTLPTGILISFINGTLSGTPQTPGQYHFTLHVKDSTSGTALTADEAVTLNVLPIFRITNPLIPGGVQFAPYSYTLLAADNVGAVTWSVSAGSLPAGLSLNSATGLISGLPTATGMSRFTIQAQDSGGHTATTAYVMLVSEQFPQFGDLGDPYADEGGGPDPAATPVNGCGTLTSGKSYKLAGNLNAANLSTVCIKIGFPGNDTKIDLAGFTINGRITLNGNGSGVIIFNGNVNCLWNDNGGDAGCIWITSTSTPVAQMRLHHLTVNNSGNFDTRSIHIDWNAPAVLNDPAYFSIRLYHITSSVPPQHTALRSYNINYQGTNQTVETSYNDFTCTADASACQGFSCFAGADCRVHGNKVTMIDNIAIQNGRAISIDGHTLGGEAFNNDVLVTNNRGVRVRSSFNIAIHDNDLQNITGAGVHLGDPDTGYDDLNCTVEHNTFQVADGGNAVFTRSAIDMFVQNNTVTCTGSCIGHLASVRNPVSVGALSILTLENNPTATVLQAPQTTVEPLATVNICNSGTAGAAPAGLGTINNISPCPAPH